MNPITTPPQSPGLLPPPAAPLPIPARAGVSLKPIYYQAILDQITTPSQSPHWFEIHAENYMGDGGNPLEYLARIRADHPISLHGVTLSLGGIDPLCPDHLERLAQLAHWLEPGLISEHLAWVHHQGIYFHDLLPPPYSKESLARTASHIQQCQDRLGRPILIENPSHYLHWPNQDYSETQFLAELVQQTGCGLLLDLNNIVVSATNLAFDPLEYLAQYPLTHVGEIHLAGAAPDQDADNSPLLIDAHDRAPAPAVWDLLAWVIAKIGPKPTLIEWDNDLPAWATLLAEASHADQLLQAGQHG